MDWPTLSTLLTLDEETWRGQLLPEVRLGQILQRHHLIDPYTLDEALAYQPHSGMRLGEILVAWGRCTPGQISRALGCQFAETRLFHLLLRQQELALAAVHAVLGMLAAEPGASLPDVLIREGLVDEARLEELMVQEYHEARLGQVLLSLGVLSEDTLAEGLTRQARTGERLGVALLTLGHCDEDDLARALALQGGPG